ncbi:unnamed protein product [Caenorhabditis bovis]|uniref:Uncharacterized protein n=1 Tax=Caenorhabditis bovis TaxID=2654633 RepID=A0A8S1EI10_9PELO|nr:unnamed protein product [Caenorhabditis bovis]
MATTHCPSIDHLYTHSPMKLQYRRTDEDLGNGPLKVRWRPNAHSLAVACPNDSVIYYDKRGNIIDALDLTGPVLDIAWDKEGDCLAVAARNSSLITLWDVNSRATDSIESSAASSKEVPTCIAWSPVSLTLAAGNNAGNLFVYNHRTSRKISLMGKHQRSITSVRFTSEDLIVTCSDDNTITISNVDGDTVSTCALSGEPTNLDVGVVSRSGAAAQTMISCILSRIILMLAPVQNIENPINLQFQERYGNIVAYSWFNDGYLAIGFDRGYLVTISAQQNELGSEIASIAEYKNYLGAVCTSQSFSKILSVGDHQIKIREIDQFNDLYAISDVDTDKDLNDVSITNDGQLVAIASQSGTLCVYVTKMPSLAAAHLNTVAHLTSLTQVTITAELDRKLSTTIETGVEPSLIGLGPTHLAVASSNRVFYFEYFLGPISQTIPTLSQAPTSIQIEYLSTVTDVKLNHEFAAVTIGAKLRLHRIHNSDESASMTFPEASRSARLVSSALTDDFLVFTTDTNYIVYFSLQEWAVVSEYRHAVPFKSIYPHPRNVICCCFDDRLETIIYSAVDDGILKLPAVGSTVHYKGAVWETFTIDRDTFAVFDNQNIYVFLMTKRRIEGESVVFVGTTKLPFGHAPLSLNKGVIKCLLPSGKISSVLLDSHKTDTVFEKKTPQQLTELLNRALLMQR